MATRYWVGGTGTWDASDTTHWAASSGGAGGQSVPGSSDTVTIDANSGAGTITVNTNFNVVSVTCGAMGMTLDFSANNNSPTMQTFSCSGTGVRTLNMGSGIWTISGGTTLIWNFTTVTNLTFNPGISTLDFSYSGSNARTVVGGDVGCYNMKISAGTGTFTFNSGFLNGTGILGYLNLTGFTGEFTGNCSLFGNLILGAGMTTTSSTNTFNLKGAGLQTLTSNGVAINQNVTVNTTGTYTLQDNLNIATSSRTLTLTQGTFNANNFNVTCGIFSSSNSNTRVLTMGSGTWTLTGTGTVWSTATATNLTLNENSSTIKITDSSATANTFSGGGESFYNIWFSREASPASNTIVGSNTFNDFKDTGTAAHSILFTTWTTQTVNEFNVNGSAWNDITLNSTTTWTHNLVKTWSVSWNDYLNIQHSVATPINSWYAWSHSTNNQWVETAWSWWIFSEVLSSPWRNKISNIISI